MPEAGQPTPSREDLRERWEQDKGSRIYLQLAEEHRRVGEHAEAVTVLEEGLQHRPRDLSGMVALGRCRLELGELEDAVLVLAEVIARDPAHIVANKLLIQAHVARGDAAAARERLTVYRLLNDRDPELEHIERELSMLDTAAAATSSASSAMPPSEAPSVAPSHEEAPKLAPEDDTAVSQRRQSSPAWESPLAHEVTEKVSGGEIRGPSRDDLFAAATVREESRPDSAPQGAPTHAVSLEESMAVEEVDPVEGGEDRAVVFELSPCPAAIDFEELWTAASGRVAAGSADPFGDLGPSAAAAAAEPVGEIFALRPGEATGYGVAAVEVASVSEVAPVAEATAVSEADRVAADAVPVAAAAPVSEAEPEVASDMASDSSSLGAGIEMPSVEMSESAPLPDEAFASVSEGFPEEVFSAEYDAPPAEEEESGSPAEALADLDGEATATLGNLYLAQGHHAEAARIFERVLERDPSHDAARHGLEQAAGVRQRPALRASDLLASPELAGQVPAGLTAKKILVLESYLRRLRPGSVASVR